MQRLYVTSDIEDLVRAGELVVIDPERPGIVVGRWIPWSELPRIMASDGLLPSSCAPPAPSDRRSRRRASRPQKHRGLKVLR